MLAKCFQHRQQLLKHGCLSIQKLLGYFSVIKHSVLYQLMTWSKVLKGNLALVIFHCKLLQLGFYPIPWYYWFISIKIPHVHAPQLAAVTIDPQPQGSVHGFNVDHWQFSTSPLKPTGKKGKRKRKKKMLNKKWRQQESSRKEFPYGNVQSSNYV